MNKFNLFENAQDYLEHGIKHLDEYYTTDNLQDIKQSIINLINCVDLLVLEKLRQIDENAIFRNDKPDKFGVGYRSTVHVGEALRQIRDELKEQITQEEREAYDVLKVLRDSAVHYEFSFGAEREGNIVFLLHYIGRFLDHELDIKLDEILEEDDYEFYLQAIEGTDYSDLLEERAEEARKELIRNEIAWYEYETTKDGAPPVVQEWSCTACDEQAVAIDNRLGVEPGVCAICGNEHEVAKCFNCGFIMNLFYEGQKMFDEYWCDSCKDHWDKQ
ncbi:hypothetical protein [Priestia megaterium]|uniref:hypothetical protein n=1 Tax=Priestia megaterium TaxID=1404 RepID=UPI0018680F2D|nr:hypothetical protein [Priestia megaterium]MBE2973064.1 hypothetical protein [Priestia megaterium]